MNTPVSYNEEINSYWKLLRNLSDGVKLRLITLLSQSMSNELDKEAVSNEKKTADFIAKFYGSWRGSESPEEIIRSIQEGRTTKSPFPFDS